jgi:hypothetical protein
MLQDVCSEILFGRSCQAEKMCTEKEKENLSQLPQKEM